MSRTIVAGIDAAPDCWAVCILSGWRGDDGWFTADSGEMYAAREIGGAIERCRALGVQRILIDMPIGLPETESRLADRQARIALGARRSSVFPAPPRETLLASDYAEACEISKQSTGRAISVQTWNLVPRIRELDSFVRGSSPDALQPEEAHPELGFAAIAGRLARAGSPLAAAVSAEPRDSGPGLRPLKEPKQRHAGMVARAALLPDPVVAVIMSGSGPQPIPATDGMDAAVLAIVAGSATAAFGDRLARDSTGLPMLIHYGVPVPDQSA